MRILLITQEFPPNIVGGVGYHAHNLARALTEQGHSVHVLAGVSNQHVRDDSMEAIPGVTISTLPYRRTIAPRLWFGWKAVRWLRSWTELEEFDLVHAHEYIDFDQFEFDGTTIQKVHFNLTEKPRFLPRPNVPAPFDDLIFELARNTLWKAERRLERRAIETADATIANSELTKHLCQERHSLDGVRIEVVYNGVDVDSFTPRTEAPDGEYLLFVGGTQDRKGYSALLEGVRRLDPAAGVTLKIVGSTGSVDTARIESTFPVQFLGRVSQARLEELYRDASGLVHPALYEPFGNVVLESLASGTPVIVSDPSHCGAAELIDDETGILVDPDDDSALAEAMQTVSDNPERFSTTRCRRLAEQHTWDHVAERTIEIACDVT